MILLLVIGIGFTWGINCLFSDGFILGNVGKWINDNAPEWITKPLIGCPPCAASIWGTLLFFAYGQMSLIWWPIYCITLCGFNYIIKEVLYGDH